jgi:hypothetical protein
MKFSTKERISSSSSGELWQSKYVYESWITPYKIINIKTNTIYYKGDLCFALIGYIDDTGKMIWVNEDKDFKRY